MILDLATTISDTGISVHTTAAVPACVSPTTLISNVILTATGVVIGIDSMISSVIEPAILLQKAVLGLDKTSESALSTASTTLSSILVSSTVRNSNIDLGGLWQAVLNVVQTVVSPVSISPPRFTKIHEVTAQSHVYRLFN